MGFLTVNHDQAQQGRYLPPEGDYECLITSANHDITRNGTEYIRITLTIRGDVPQEGREETIDWPVWKRREPSPSDPDGYPIGTIQQISRVTNLPNGKNYKTIDDWMNAIRLKPIRVNVRHEEYNGRTNARVGYMYKTHFPNVQTAPLTKIEEEDLPF